MNINSHISSLLYRYQCVTVPGFGAFLTEIQSAQLNGSAVTFNPPTKVVSFNANIKNNDGLLANHIALTEKISYEEAVTSISNVVGSWMEKLQTRETLSIENIGNIKLSSEMTWFFEPINNTNYLTSSFGLSNFISPSIKREELKKIVEELEEVAPIIFTPEKKKNYSYLKYAAAAVLFFGLAGTFGYKQYYDTKIEQETLLVEKSVQEKVQNKIQEATFFINTPLPEVNIAVEEDTKNYPYHVVAGVFSNEQNAKNAYADLIQQGFKAELGPKSNNGMNPVYFQSFVDYSEAKSFLDKMRNTSNSQAWLLID
ncbi:SPOR domain-containing protein [uncultured Flavobacterium sp.]|uniref:HU domain-containing protein n=1 Tax=uncultured Flavobacterium sp. TaxID=165435 RepID=UPI0030EEEC78